MKPSVEIQRWAETKAELDRVKARELEQRLALIAKHFADPPEEGTVAVDVGAGHELVATFALRYGLPNEELTRPVLDKMAKADPAGGELVKRLVKWTPELRISEWRKLPPKLAKLIAAIVKTPPATPTLELRSPK